MQARPKYLYSLLLLCLAAPGFCFPEWEWQSPVPQGGALNDIQVFPGGAGWAVGNYAILKSSDGGSTWALFQEWRFEAITQLSFVNQDTGWIASPCNYPEGLTARIRLTTDGGAHWDIQSEQAGVVISDLHFVNSQIGIAVGDSSNYNTILRTTNGGNSWTRQIDTTGYGGLDEIEFIDQQEGWIVGHHVTLHTTDSGNSWQTINQEWLNLSDVQFFDARLGFAVSHQYVYRTQDGGCNWIEIYPLLGGVSQYHLCFADSLNGWVASHNGSLVHTTNGGLDWQEQTFNPSAAALELICANVDNAWITTNRGEIYHTINGGQNWAIQAGQRITSASMRSVFFADRNNGWATASNGDGHSTIMRTTNGGDDWSVVYYSPTETGLNGIFAHSSLEAWAVFSGAQIRHTTDGGQNWTNQTISGEGSWGLDDIYFAGADTGWVLTGTKIHRTTNGGQTWAPHNLRSFPAENFTAICMSFVDGLYGWIGGGAPGCIMRTTDGGINWSTQFFDEANDETVVESISFIDRSHGWAGGWDDFAFHTTNGGTTWDSVTFHGATAGIKYIQFADHNHGWAHNSMHFYFTADCGNTWYNMRCPLYQISDMQLLDWERGWIIEGSGNILYWNNEMQAVEPGSPNSIPESCTLTAYPNPFNPVTTLDYSVPHAGRTTLKVFDITGRIVQTLTDRVLSVGNYKIEFDGSGLPSGVYFVRLNGSGFGTTHKIVLLK